MARINDPKTNQMRALKRAQRNLGTQTPLRNTSVSGGQTRFIGTDSMIVQGSSLISGSQTISGSEVITGSETINGSLRVNGSTRIDGAMTVNTPGALFNGELIATGGLSLFSTPTTTSAANLRRSALGIVQEVTSGAQYKIDPQPMLLPPELLDVPVQWWIDRSDAETIAELYDAPRPFRRIDQARWDGASLKRVPGAIAQEVHAAGGEAFVSHDLDGEIKSVDYDRFALARTAILADRLQAADARLDDAMRLIEDLEARVRALESAAS